MINSFGVNIDTDDNHATYNNTDGFQVDLGEGEIKYVLENVKNSKGKLENEKKARRNRRRSGLRKLPWVETNQPLPNNFPRELDVFGLDEFEIATKHNLDLVQEDGSKLAYKEKIEHCTKNHICSFKIFWKDDLSKKITLKSGKMMFHFPENMILFFRRKMKDDLSPKKYMEIWYILQMFQKDGLSEKIALEYDLSVYHDERWHFFFPKIYLFTDGKWKMIFLKKYMEIWCFLYVGKDGIYFSNKDEITILSKKQRWSFPGITSKDDIHPRKDDIGILCTFMEIFLNFSIHCFPIKKSQET